MNVRIFLTGLFALIATFLLALALAPVAAKPASGGYQLFEPTALADQHAIQLAALENFDYHAKIAPECCNATKGGDGVLAGDSYVPSGSAIIRGSTVRLDQSIITKNGEIIPAGSVITENGGAIKIVTPDGQQITGKTDNLIGSQKLALPPPATKGGFSYTDAVAVYGTRAIDKAVSYENGVRSLYSGASFSERQFSAIVDGKRVNGVADDVAIIGGKPTAVESKFTGNWTTSPRNPNSSVANIPFAAAERNKMIAQAKSYTAGFRGGAVYHTNSADLASHYTRVFNDAGITNFKFVITPTK